MTGLLLLFNLLLLTQPALQAASCYYPDGTFVSFDSPCFPDQETSFCCGQGHTCMSNNLCRWPDSQMPYPLAYIRGSCTDSSWNSPECGDVCKAVLPSQYDPIVACPGSEFCCDSGSSNVSSCCSLTNTTAHPIYRLEAASTVTVIGVSPTPSVTVSVSIATITTTSMSTPSNSSDGNGGGSIGTGAKIGIGVGVGVGVVLILASIGLLFCVRRKRVGGAIHQVAPGSLEQHHNVIPKAELPGVSADVLYNNAPKQKGDEGWRVNSGQKLQEMP
ncbi:hypothetical protein DL95DRAFT_480684 [Leptodontidium sp. 2 PMI_412]|nr:hypothetical protein DL95DRAFT_480684 [Leptodontidium sp. 2 PMI_412]